MRLNHALAERAPSPASLFMTADSVGGVWRYAAELSRGLSGRGWRVTLAVAGPAPSTLQREDLAPGVHLIETGVPLDWCAVHPTELAAAAATLAGLAAAHDTVLLHAPAFLGECAWPAPVAVMAHSCLTTWWQAVRGGPVDQDYAWRAEAAAAGFRRAGAVAAPSAAFAQDIARTYGLAGVAVIHNGRSPMALPPAWRGDAVLTAGRLWDDGKNAALLDRVARQLGAPVWAAGSTRGPAGQSVTFSNLQVLGSLSEAAIAEAYASATVFASAARYEPFGLAVLEAAQAGLALVLSDIPTFRELWDGAAVFVPPDDDAAWLAALRAMLADPEPWGDRARRRAARYGAAAMVDGTAAWLSQLIASSSSRTESAAVQGNPAGLAA